MSEKTTKVSGQFPKGFSGNPAGRPRGSRNRATLIMESLLEGKVETLTQKAIELAIGGNIQALRLCLDRIPARKDRPVQLELPPAETIQQISSSISRISAAIAEGEITPSEGESLTKVLSTQAELILAAEFERRLEELEHLKTPSPNSSRDEGKHTEDKAA